MNFKIWIESNQMPNIFLDLDDTLVHNVKSSELKRMKLALDHLQSKNAPSNLLDRSKRNIEALEKCPRFMMGTEEWIVYPRNGLHEFLKKISSIGYIHILSSAEREYIVKTINALKLERTFSGVYSTRTDNPPKVVGTKKWVLVDDIFDWGKLKSLGAEVDLDYPTETPNLKELKDHIIRIPALILGSQDSELIRIIQEIAVKLA